MKQLHLAYDCRAIAAGHYVYKVVTSGTSHLASICSDDSLCIYDKDRLDVTHVIQAVHEGVTSLISWSPDSGNSFLATAGRDGSVKGWDLRQHRQTPVFDFRHIDAPVLCLASSVSSVFAAGTELVNAEASVVLWDVRSNLPLTRYNECHSDDVTVLHYHPTRPDRLLSGSTDGLINIYDTTVIPTNADDEDEVLDTVFNNESSVHHANWLSETNWTQIYGLSHDELFSIFTIPTTTDDGDEEEDVKQSFGDLRPQLDSEYIVDVVGVSGKTCIISGNHTNQWLDILPLKHGAVWEIDRDAAVRLPGAHGDEIVRSLCYDETSGVVYTAGEDGHIKAWTSDDADTSSKISTAHVDRITTSKVKAKEKRFKPY